MKKAKINPRHVFRIYPEPKSNLFCHVSIWRSVEEMRRAVDIGTDYDGVCTEVIIIDCRKGKRERKKPIFAEMHLALDAITHRVTTHEIFHATLYWMRRRKITSEMAEDSMKTEERCAYAYTQLRDNLLENLTNHHLQVRE